MKIGSIAKEALVVGALFSGVIGAASINSNYQNKISRAYDENYQMLTAQIPRDDFVKLSLAMDKTNANRTAVYEELANGFKSCMAKKSGVIQACKNAVVENTMKMVNSKKI